MTNEFWKVNIGNIITIVVFVVGAIGVWYKDRFRNDEHAVKIQKMESSLKEFESKGVLLVLGQHEARLAKLEGLQNTLNTMSTDVALIKQSIEYIKEKQQLAS